MKNNANKILKVVCEPQKEFSGYLNKMFKRHKMLRLQLKCSHITLVNIIFFCICIINTKPFIYK